MHNNIADDVETILKSRTTKGRIKMINTLILSNEV